MEKLIVLFSSLLLFCSDLYAQTTPGISLSEIMFKPSASNSEFIEIYNTSDSQALNLEGYKFKYHTSSAEAIHSADNNFIFPPKSFAVILEKDYDVEGGIYADVIPEGTLILFVKDNAFGSSGMSNSSDKTIALLNPQDEVISTHTYSADNGYGISEEKIILDGIDDPSNWSNSTRTNGTPGHINSVTPKTYDLALTRFESAAGFSPVGKSDKFFLTVVNSGVEAADVFEVKLYHDRNKNSRGDAEELISREEYTDLPAAAETEIEFIVDDYIEGDNYYIAAIVYNDDEYVLNNLLTYIIFGVTINEERGDIVINEIMYAPYDEEPEWIEIYNNSGKEINLLKYKLADENSSSQIIDVPMIFPPGDYLVIAKDSAIYEKYNIPSDAVIASFPALNNSGDVVMLQDSLGRVIDSLHYTPGMGGDNGRSLERCEPYLPSIDTSNWKTCHSTIGATPGFINSVTQKEYDLAVIDLIPAPLYPLIGDDVSLQAVVKNEGKSSLQFSVDLYLVDEETNDLTILETGNATSAAPDEIVHYPFNYIMQGLEATRVFAAVLNSSVDQDTSNNYCEITLTPGYPSGTVIINEIMFYPANEEPEWIEFYNNSDYEINIKNWTVSDIITVPVSKHITMDDGLINPKEYFVVAKDSSIKYYHRDLPELMFITDFANLNNDEDGIVLKDFRGMTIDSVRYAQSRQSEKGYSIERKQFDLPSNQIDNWGISTDTEQSTPGRINSIAVKKYDVAVKSLITDPKYPVLNNEIFVSVKVKNHGTERAENFSVKVFYEVEDIETILHEVTGMSLAPEDFSIITSSGTFHLTGETTISAEVVFSEDWDNANNTSEIIVQPGCGKYSLLVNEIMYNPKAGQPEWIEIVNVSDEEVNLKNWAVSDVLSSPTKNIITADDFYLQPNDLFVVTADTGSFKYLNPECICFETDFGSLGNSKDGIVIYDFRNAVIDSVFYENSWGGGDGCSLERVSVNASSSSSDNWSTSLNTAGCSPGMNNSVNEIPQYDFMDLVINEIMYDPDEDNAEYIELFNCGSSPVQLGGFAVSDDTGNRFIIARAHTLLAPGEYFLIAADSSLCDYYSLEEMDGNICVIKESGFSLSNSGEKLSLYDLWGNVIDSLSYDPDWHNDNILTHDNKSLEKINSSAESDNGANWSTSVSMIGGTPGKINSINIERKTGESKITIAPNPFSPDNDGFEDFTIISYTLTQPIAQMRVKIFDSKGRPVRELLNNQPSGSTGSFIFDGLDDNGNPLKMGIYIIFMEALNSSSGVVDVLKEVVVVARKL